MFAFLRSPFRVLLAAVFMGFVSISTAQATKSTGRDTTYANSQHPVNTGDPDVGLLWIVVGIVVVVFFVWLCAKVTDSSRPSDGVMG